MSLRDELQSWLDEVTFRSVWPIIERALAAERAATIRQSAMTVRAKMFGDISYPPEWDEKMTVEEQRTLLHMCEHIFNQAKEEAAHDVEELPHDRSALDEMLAQARAEQREKDALMIDNLKRAIEEGKVAT